MSGAGREPRDAGAGAPQLEPSAVAIASVACGSGGLVLAGLGSLGGRVGLLGPVAAYGGLVVALGATIVGTTLAAVALLATRDGVPAARTRAWVGAAINLGLLLALVAVLARGVGRPLVVEAEGPPAVAAAAGEETVLDAAALRELRVAHPELLPLAIAVPVEEAFERARRTAEALGWEIVASDAAARRLEARAGSEGPDLSIRVYPAPDGAVVAIRPTGDGRVAESRARIRAFAERLTRS